jgi:hypothetical protein
VNLTESRWGIKNIMKPSIYKLDINPIFWLVEGLF